MQNIYLHSLGCEKNTVDGEHILAILEKKGFNITNNPEEADIIIINTCAFIEDSKKESIDAIFDHSIYKKYGKYDCHIILLHIRELFFISGFPEFQESADKREDHEAAADRK